MTKGKGGKASPMSRRVFMGYDVKGRKVQKMSVRDIGRTSIGGPAGVLAKKGRKHPPK